MAKICIFNTDVAVDSAGDVFQSIVPVPPDAAFRTKPVRLFNASECSFEFIFTGDGGQLLELFWWREFWGDDPRASLKEPPSDRVIPGIAAGVPWSRETRQEVDGGTGNLVCKQVTRETRLSIPLGALGDTWWVTTAVHAPWVRLALYASAAIGPDADLLINAHVGGHAEDKFLTENGQYPYVYNA